LRRALPRMSPALLSLRLTELADAGVVARRPLGIAGDPHAYVLTEAGAALGDVVGAFAVWGQTWMERQATLDNASPDHLMWELRRHARPDRAPRTPSVINFIFDEQPTPKANWWLILETAETAEVCHDDPGRDPDLYVLTDVRTLTAIWLGLSLARDEVDKGSLVLTGDRRLADTLQGWLGLSPVSGVPKRGGVRPR